MRKLFFSRKEFSRVLKLKNKVEKALDIKIEIKKDGITVESKKEDPFLEYIASKILEAVSLGFDADSAMQLQDTNYIMRKINVKDLVRASKINLAIARVIGTKGKTKKIISGLTECDIIVTDYDVAVIGKGDNVETATNALISLIKGSKQSNIYNFLEKNRARLRELEEEDIEEFIEKK